MIKRTSGEGWAFVSEDVFDTDEEVLVSRARGGAADSDFAGETEEGQGGDAGWRSGAGEGRYEGSGAGLARSVWNGRDVSAGYD